MSKRNLTPDFAEGLAKTLAKVNLAACLQCRKCSNGCPVAGGADILPHELVRLIQLGQRAEVLTSAMIWKCTSCQTCVTRCPMKIDIAALNDQLRQLSSQAGQATSATTVPAFNELFLKAVRKRGRVFEPGLMAAYKLRTRRFFEDLGKLPLMLARRKLPLLPRRVPGGAQRQAMFKRAGRGAGEGKQP